MKTLRFTFILVAPLFFGLPLSQAKDKQNNTEVNIYQSINASYIIGAQVFNDNFIYNPGYSISLSQGFFVNNNVGIGFGIAHKGFESESFLPVYGEIIGYKKNKHNAPFIRMQAGYAFGWDNNETGAEGYQFHGGVFISAGMGRKFRISDSYSVMLHWSYQHQFARMEYNIFGTTGYKETLNYDMLVISIGFIREK